MDYYSLIHNMIGRNWKISVLGVYCFSNTWPSLGVTAVLSLGASGGQEAVNGQQTWHYSGYASSQAKYKLAVLSWEDRSFSSNPCVETWCHVKDWQQRSWCARLTYVGRGHCRYCLQRLFHLHCSWELTSLHCRARMQYNIIYWEGTAEVLHGVVLIHREQ